jgi:hypothetical protein
VNSTQWQPQAPPQHPPAPLAGAFDIAEASPASTPFDERTANADMSLAVSLDPHSGQAITTGDPLPFTSSSKRWSQLPHAYS